MRFLFKTSYNQDIRLFQHSGQVWSYLALIAFMLVAPLMLSSYLQSQLVSVFIYAIVGVALMISPVRGSTTVAPELQPRVDRCTQLIML